jgi:transposase
MRGRDGEVPRSLPHVTEEELPELPLKKKRNLMSFNVGDHAYKMLGGIIFRIRGLNSETVLRIVSEVGVDLSAFPRAAFRKLVMSESELASVRRQGIIEPNKPEQQSSGGGVSSSGCECEREPERIGSVLSAQALAEGAASAAIATAHKIARLYYSLVKNGTEYQEQGARAYEERERERIVASLKKRAKTLGFELVSKAASHSFASARKQ